MGDPIESPVAPSTSKKHSWQRKTLVYLFSWILVAGLLVGGWILYPNYFPVVEPVRGTSTPTIEEKNKGTAGTPAVLLTNPGETPTGSVEHRLPAGAAGGTDLTDMIVFAMRDGNFSHLFAFHPHNFPLTRITNSQWDDADPAISPDGTKIAFRSRRNGYWDIHILELKTGKISRLTDTPEYDGSPTWSPDGQWIAFKSYQGDQMDIMIRSITDPAQPAINLTNSEGSNFQPAWSPGGREIVFVSTRSGDQEIWLAKLDQTENRYGNISQQPASQDSHPAWSPDGKKIAWSSEAAGLRQIEVIDLRTAGQKSQVLALGSIPGWSPEGDRLLIVLNTPNRTILSAYLPGQRVEGFPAILLGGNVDGISWGGKAFAEMILKYSFPSGATAPLPVLWKAALSVNPQPPGGRYGLVALNGVTAPYPYLHDFIDESFQELRKRTAIEAGWNFLDSLESAYQPLTIPPAPDMEENWLMTGRAIAVNSTPMSAGWMAIVREEYLGQTYWRVFIRARYQDGSQGIPLSNMTWDNTARYAGNPQAYEDGGKIAPVPAGYWIDFTELARRFGWERLAALNGWRTYYAATRFNQFVLTDGRTWASAMAEVYPPEALATITPVPSRTPKPSPTPENYQPGGPMPSLFPTRVPTYRPTWTPSP